MKKIFILLSLTFLLVGCAESVVTLGGGAANGKLAQSSLQSAASFVVKEKTGKTPIGHVLGYVKENNTKQTEESCSSFTGKKNKEICLMVEKRIISKQAKVKEKESFNNPSKELTSSLQSSINDRSKIKYLDQ